jgi:hypothetical protein
MLPLTNRVYALLPLVIVVITVFGILTCALTFYYAQKSLIVLAGNSLALASDEIAGKLDMWMTESYRDVKMLAHSPIFEQRNSMAMNGYVRGMADTHPQYDWLGAVDAAGRIIAATDSASVGSDQSAQDWFVAVRESGKVHVGEPQRFVESQNVIAIALTAPIVGKSGEFLGAVTSRWKISSCAQ